MFLSSESQFGTVAGAVYTVLLLIAAIWDFRTRRIPNRLVAVLAVLGLASSILATPFLPGALRSMGGLLIGFACWLPFYALGWLGAGDVKLFAAAGSWLGPLRTIEGALVAAIAGAVLALVWMGWTYGARKGATDLAIALTLPSTLARGPAAQATRKTLPYGVALALGALTAAWAPGLLLR